MRLKIYIDVKAIVERGQTILDLLETKTPRDLRLCRILISQQALGLEQLIDNINTRSTLKSLLDLHAPATIKELSRETILKR